MDANFNHTRIETRDGFQLAATVFESPKAIARNAVILIVSAAGVRRRFYTNYARFLAEHGFTVVAFDYRGIGDSQPIPIHTINAQLHDWGELDLTAVIEWLGRTFPHHALFGLGHSIGGQILGIAENNKRFSAIMTVASQSGYWNLWNGGTKWALCLLWYVAMPFLARLYSYFPAKRLGLGENLPRGVALEWAQWSRDPKYLFGTSGRPSVKHFREVRAPFRAYSFSDDNFAPKRAVDALLGAYSGTSIEHQHIHPAELGMKSIGHFGFFRDACKPTLWHDSLKWFVAQADK
jgi:predicted alpha/beta hydrolase